MCMMTGFQAGNIDAIRAERVVCTVKIGDARWKVFQIFFGKDRSLFITFPYYRHREGLLCASGIPPTDALNPQQINLAIGGKVTSHLVKYSHHPDGRAHFSQTGKIVTAIKRQSIDLDTQDGHMFSLNIQGVGSLDVADPLKDTNKGAKRQVVDFEVEPTEALKFVGRWYDVDRMRFNNPVPTIGPIVPLLDDAGVSRLGCMIASPYENARHVLLLTCESIPPLGSQAQETFIFVGGFDPKENFTDITREAGFLAFIYPISEADKLKEQIGTVDYHPPT
jgi:hypothetical protein